jgi:cysteinyl-tRNA synthetase
MGRELVDFVPRDEGKVGIYVCGPTVQSEPHVGHGRYAVAFDVIRRYLTWRGFDVTYVSNITDVEDKIIAAAEEAGESVEELAVKMTERFVTSFKRLGVLHPMSSRRPPSTSPRCWISSRVSSSEDWPTPVTATSISRYALSSRMGVSPAASPTS